MQRNKSTCTRFGIFMMFVVGIQVYSLAQGTKPLTVLGESDSIKIHRYVPPGVHDVYKLVISEKTHEPWRWNYYQITDTTLISGFIKTIENRPMYGFLAYDVDNELFFYDKQGQLITKWYVYKPQYRHAGAYKDSLRLVDAMSDCYISSGFWNDFFTKATLV